MKTVMTITGIRPDFIRMSEVFKRLDETFNHILVHTGQHYDEMLSDVFFKELNIRQPDYNLGIGSKGRRHHEQLADLSIKIIDLIETNKLAPDIILFLGDSNSVACSVPLKKEGYRIGHIEAGMRSYDRRMLEEINRVVCDHCSDFLFVYHADYARNCFREGISPGQVRVVGNTIVEVCKQFEFTTLKLENQIILDIHRPENFNYPARMNNILDFANSCGDQFRLPVKLLRFPRSLNAIEQAGINLGDIELIDLMSYKEYLSAQRNALFMISDSGTAQEEPALLGTPVIVPRDFTERPQSVANNCSFMVNMNFMDFSWQGSIDFVRKIKSGVSMQTEWLGEGRTAGIIVESLKELLP